MILKILITLNDNDEIFELYNNIVKNIVNLMMLMTWLTLWYTHDIENFGLFKKKLTSLGTPPSQIKVSLLYF